MDGSDKTVVRKSAEKNTKKDDTTVFRSINRTRKPVQHDKTVVRKPATQQLQSEDALQPAYVDKLIKDTTPPDKPVNNRNQSTRVPGILQKRFKLQKVIGVGGMGVVYKAVDLRKVEAKDRNPFVAIKVLNEEFKKHPDSLIALQREARKSQSIAHPNIVNVHDFDRDGDVVFMTMEYLEGQPLDKVLKQFQYVGLPMNEAWEVLRGICEALIYAHQENIVHSDFKPGNIFLTSKGSAKVFDFGISRAVNRSDLKSDNDGEKTLFDAGTLGALTPAYASLEMLNGGMPDERDDIYALGCVAYEIFSGEHPFGKLSADKACAKKLKPKRLDELSNTQWGALQRALAFKRKDRISSVQDFYDLMFTKKVSNARLFAALGLSAAIAISSVLYIQFFSSGDVIVQGGITQIEIDNSKDDVSKLLESPNFTSLQWHDDLWLAFKQLWKVMPENDGWGYEAENKVIKLYIAEISRLISDQKIDDADILLAEASKFNDTRGLLKGIKSEIQQKRRDIRLQEIAELKKQQEAQRRLFEQQKASIRDNILKEQQINAAEQKRNYNIALNNVSKELLCRNGMNARALGKALRQLNTIDAERYQKQMPRFVESTIACINKVSIDNYDQAKKLKSYAMQIFPGNKQVAGLTIGYVDLCKPGYAGKGGKNSRAFCQDALSIGEQGPKMVVVRSASDRSVYAISKYEISNRDFNLFCEDTDHCKPVSDDLDLPVHNVSHSLVKSYIQWLNKNTFQTYALPTYSQWLNAARADGGKIDPNRNCSLDSRGILKGQSLVKVNLGKQNSWGLVNMVGNVQEWVVRGKTSELYVVGGSRKDPFQSCNLNNLKKDDGIARDITGFRLVRKII